jgi:hypothetical protein
MATRAASQVAAAHAALARNLLSSVLALAFPENLASDASAQREFLLQLPQLLALLSQHNVFDFVTDGKALDKLQTRLFELIDTAQGVDRSVKAAAFELLLVAVEQCPLDALEALVPKLTERILKMVKYLKDAPRVIALASDVTRVVVRHVDLFTPEVRRDVHDWLSKLLPASVAVLTDLVATAEPLTQEQLALFGSITGVFIELLEVSPSAVRGTQAKLEAAVVALALYNPAVASDSTAARAAAQCLALVANASDKPHAMWKQIVDKAIEMAHQLVDPIAGKRPATAATAPTGMKVWLRETGGSSGAADLEALAVYQRTQRLVERLEVVVLVLEASFQSRAVSEREVQLVIHETVALTRRLVTVRAQEIGKQSAISEDGVRLPLSVVYGALPQLHALGFRCLQAVVSRAGLCALRHASKIAKVLILGSEQVHSQCHAALYDAVSVCVRVLGASTLEKLGQPLLDHVVSQCKQDLLDKPLKNEDGKPSLTDGKSGGKAGGKGKKRKRQIGDLSQLASDAGTTGVSFLSTRNHRVVGANVDAALGAIATCVAVYGSLLPADTRALASDVALLAVQQQKVNQAPVGAGGNLAMLLLADATTADAHSAHATNLVQSLDYWSSSTAPSLLRLVALNVGEALMHPRAPPLSINFDSAIQAHTSSAPSSNGFLTNRVAPMVPAAAAVRGHLDWEREEEDATEPEKEAAVVEEVSKRAKTSEQHEEDVAMAEASAEDEEEEEDEEDDFEDERPVAVEASEEDKAEEKEEEEEEEQVAPVTKAMTSAAVADDDDDEFPDIVVDDEDDE